MKTASLLAILGHASSSTGEGLSRETNFQFDDGVGKKNVLVMYMFCKQRTYKILIILHYQGFAT